jgi:hypothetical protein
MINPFQSYWHNPASINNHHFNDHVHVLFSLTVLGLSVRVDAGVYETNVKILSDTKTPNY